MDEYIKNRLIILGGIVAVFIIFLWMYVWATYINFGDIEFNSTSPYLITFENDEVENCNKNKCIIRKPVGSGQYTASKAGYTSLEGDYKVSRNERFVVELDFQSIPFVKETEQKKFKSDEYKYGVVFDENANAQKLIKIGDITEKPLIWFKEYLDVANIYGGKNNVLLTTKDKRVFTIDLRKKSRSEMYGTSLASAKTIKWSIDGDLAFITANGDVSVINNKEEIVVTVADKNKNVIINWGLRGSLYILEGNGDVGISIYEYDINDGEKKMIELSNSYGVSGYWPDEFYVLGDNIALYLTNRDKSFRIEL